MYTEKRCPRCTQTLPASAFTPSSSQPSGLSPYCKPCAAEYLRKRRHGIEVPKVRMETIQRDDSGNVTMKRCPKCEQELPASAFTLNTAQPSGLTVYCKKCWDTYISPRKAEYNHTSYERHAGARRQLARDYYAQHAEERRSYSRAWREANPERLRESLKQRNQRIKLAALNAYGGTVCGCCGETTLAFLSLDHANNDGAAHRKITGAGSRLYNWLLREGYPQDLNLRVLCFNCNLGRRVNGGTCPHQDS